MNNNPCILRARVTRRVDRTLENAIEGRHTRGPQPPLDYVPREPLHTETESPARARLSQCCWAFSFSRAS